MSALLPGRRLQPRDVGTGLLLVLAAAGLIVYGGKRAGLWQERGLILVSVRDPQGLKVGSRVWFRGVDIGEVADVRAPAPDQPGYKLRLAVDRTAFKHVPLDSPVRIDPGRGNSPDQVTILPGREKPEWDFPGQVKVLREVTPAEDALRLIRDLLDGLTELSRAKASEAELLELREQVRVLKARLEELEKTANPPPTGQ